MAVKNRETHGESSEYDNEGYRHAPTCQRLVLTPSVILPSMPRSVKCSFPLLLSRLNVIYFQTSSTSLVSSPEQCWVKSVKLYTVFSLAVFVYTQMFPSAFRPVTFKVCTGVNI